MQENISVYIKQIKIISILLGCLIVITVVLVVITVSIVEFISRFHHLILYGLRKSHVLFEFSLLIQALLYIWHSILRLMKHLNGRRHLTHLQIVVYMFADGLKILFTVSVFLSCGNVGMQCKIRREKFQIVGHWQLVRYLFVYKQRRLICPAASDIAWCVSTTTNDQGRHIELLDKIDALAMTLGTQREASKPITGQRVSSALQNDCGWSIEFHHICDNWFEDLPNYPELAIYNFHKKFSTYLKVTKIINSFLQGYIH